MGARSGSRTREAEGGFAALVARLAGAPRADAIHPLAEMDYAAEVALKQEALAQFWQRHGLRGEPRSLVRSPKPRGYRTSTKRRVRVRDGNAVLVAGDDREIGRSPLEPREHTEIYRIVTQHLRESRWRSLAARLNYVIVRGSYAERALVWNVDRLNSTIVRQLRALGEKLRGPLVSACFVYVDPTRSDYYLESWRPSEGVAFKKLYGRDELLVRFGDHTYRFHPTAFSQVNEAVVPAMLRCAADLLAPTGDEGLLDLYCGYGLFSHHFADRYRRVVGVEIEGPSVRSAIANAGRIASRTPRRFLAARIDRELVGERLQRGRGPEIQILDPPRSGTLQGVIPALAARRPDKVLHVFCSVDRIPEALREWRAGGLAVQGVVPVDMFPGTAGLEVLVLMA